MLAVIHIGIKKICRQPMTSDFELVSPYLPRAPGEGNIADRYWRSCHNSAIPLLVRLANIEGFPPSL